MKLCRIKIFVDSIVVVRVSVRSKVSVMVRVKLVLGLG